MKKTMSWGLDRKPSPEMLLEWYDQLDRQVGEIKRQMRRGIIGPHHVQAFVEHSAYIFPDAFWTVTSRDCTVEALLEDISSAGWKIDKNYEKKVRGCVLAADVTYHLAGIRGSKFMPANYDAVIAEGVRRKYRGAPIPAIGLLAGRYTRKDLGGYEHIYFVDDSSRSLSVSMFWAWDDKGRRCDYLRSDGEMYPLMLGSDDLFVFQVPMNVE